MHLIYYVYYSQLNEGISYQTLQSNNHISNNHTVCQSDVYSLTAITKYC